MKESESQYSPGIGVACRDEMRLLVAGSSLFHQSSDGSTKVLLIGVCPFVGESFGGPGQSVLLACM